MLCSCAPALFDPGTPEAIIQKWTGHQLQLYIEDKDSQLQFSHIPALL